MLLEDAVQLAQNGIAPCKERVTLVGKVPERWVCGSRQGYVTNLRFFVRLIREEAQFIGKFAKELAKLLTIIGSGRCDASFPPADIHKRSTDPGCQLLLRPMAF
jgi:hypothetical protein